MIRAAISLSNYKHNLQLIRDTVGPDVKILAAVKANAYGHGLVEIAKVSTEWGVDYLGVVRVEEVRELRQAGVSTPILMLALCEPENLAEAIDLGVTLSVHSLEHLQQIIDQQKPTTVHIKVDTGMHRAGSAVGDVVEMAKLCEAEPNVTLEGMYTHLAESEDPNTDFTNQQLDRFDDVLAKLKEDNLVPAIIHAANSGGIFAHHRAHYAMVRPGLSTYGLNPFGPEHELYVSLDEKLQPVMRLTSSIALIREIEPGESVGYNRRWTAERPSRIALIAGGYGDGWRRGPYNAGVVLVNGQSVLIVGSVAMDQFCIDITDIEAHPGDEVVLIGDSLSTRDVANAWQTIDYEVVTSVRSRVKRDHVD